MAIGDSRLLNIALEQWRNDHVAEVEVMNIGGQVLFPVFTGTSGLACKCVVVLYKLGDGYSARFDGGKLPKPEEGIVCDLGGHCFCTLEFTYEQLRSGIDPLFEVLTATTGELNYRYMMARSKPTIWQRPVLQWLRLKRKLYAFKAAA